MEELLQKQRMTACEVTAVVRLWAKRQEERERRAGEPTIADVAEGLDISLEEAYALLQEVRSRQEAAVRWRPLNGTRSRYSVRRLNRRYNILPSLHDAVLRQFSALKHRTRTASLTPCNAVCYNAPNILMN